MEGGEENANNKTIYGCQKIYCNSRRRNGVGVAYNILATATTNDTGTPATAFPTAPAYYNLYINAQIQSADTSTVTTTAITIPGGDALDPATPIVIEFVVN